MPDKVEIEKPGEIYKEIKKLIGVHYTGQSEVEAGASFITQYPELYRLYLRIAALGLNK